MMNLSWFQQDLKAILDGGNDLPFPDGLLINGQGSNGNTFTVDQGDLIIPTSMELPSFFIFVCLF